MKIRRDENVSMFRIPKIKILRRRDRFNRERESLEATFKKYSKSIIYDFTE